MAAKSNSPVSFAALSADLRARRFAPIYILMGEEAYYLDRAVELLEQNVVDEADRDFNSYTYYGADTQPDVVVATAQQLPMMAERQLVVLKEAQAMLRAKQQLDKLAGYASRPNPQTVLAIVYKGDSLGATSKLMKAVAKTGGVVFVSNRLRENQMAGAAIGYAKEKGLSIDEKAATMLASFVGDDMSRLTGEIDKLAVALPAGTRAIDAAAVEANIGISKDYNIYEMTSAVALRDFARAMKIADHFGRNPKTYPVQATIGALFNLFSKVAVVLWSTDRSEAAMMRALQARSTWALRDVKAALRAYSPVQIVRAVHTLRDADGKSKGIGGTLNDAELLRELVFNLMRP